MVRTQSLSGLILNLPESARSCREVGLIWVPRYSEVTRLWARILWILVVPEYVPCGRTNSPVHTLDLVLGLFLSGYFSLSLDVQLLALFRVLRC